MGEQSPAFSFYARDFMVGAAAMTLEQRGAYVTLLCYQWDAFAVPGDLTALAALLGQTPAKTKELWAVVEKKFAQQLDGTWLNERLEKERIKQATRSHRLAENGSKGGSTKAANAKQDAKQIASKATPIEVATEQQKPSLAFASSSSERAKDHPLTPPARVAVQGPGSFEPGSLPRDHKNHAICGPRFRLCLSSQVFASLKGKYGGTPDEARTALETFVSHIETLVGDGAIGDHLWLLNHFDAWLVTRGRVAPAPESPTKIQAGDNFKGIKDFVSNG